MPAYRMVIRAISVLLMLTSGMTMIAGSSDAQQQSVAPARDSPDSPSVGTTIADTLGDVPLSTKFKIPGSVGTLIESDQSIGLEFTLTQPTTITEIGGFIESCYPSIKDRPKTCPRIPAVVVNIHPALKSSLDPSAIIASYTLSNDNDPSSISYESVQVSLRLEPGTYYAMFTNTDANAVVLSAASYPFEYRCKSGSIGMIHRSGAVSTNAQFMGVRILGTLTRP